MTSSPHAVPFLILLHAAAALAALAIGTVLMLGPKGTGRHRALGGAWAGALAFVALSSFWISKEQMRLGPFSPIHALSAFTLVMLPVGLVAARRRRIVRHRWTMTGLYAGALVIAGLFTLAPGRIMGRALFGP